MGLLVILLSMRRCSCTQAFKLSEDGALTSEPQAESEDEPQEGYLVPAIRAILPSRPAIACTW
jgi:hypothetical protein